MKRSCAACGRDFEAKRSTAKYCGSSCRARKAQGKVRASAARPDDQESESIAEALRAELESLGVLEQYEARTTLRLARQLDSGVIVGAAFVSQSKELDRRVEELRRRAPKADDPTQGARESVRERRLRLASG
jgi:hypothetical protein